MITSAGDFLGQVSFMSTESTNLKLTSSTKWLRGKVTSC